MFGNKENININYGVCIHEIQLDSSQLDSISSMFKNVDECVMAMLGKEMA